MNEKGLVYVSHSCIQILTWPTSCIFLTILAKQYNNNLSLSPQQLIVISQLNDFRRKSGAIQQNSNFWPVEPMTS